jgi:starch synthase (maltosyl-transferring)
MGRCLNSAVPSAAAGELRERSGFRAPAIYYLSHGNGDADWPGRLGQAVRLGFDQVCLNPFLTHRDEPLLAVDLDRPHPGLGLRGSLADAVHEIANLSARQGLRLCLDVVLDRMAADGRAVQQADGLFERRHQSDVIDPHVDPTLVRAATVRYNEADPERLVTWWVNHLVPLVQAGAGGFRLLGLDLLPAGVVGAIAQAVRRQAPCTFFAWTPGVAWTRHDELAAAGLDGVFASTPWWDGQAGWYAEELASLVRIAPVIGVAEAPLRPRSMDIAERRRAVQLAAATGDGLFLPEGFECDIESDVERAVGAFRRSRPQGPTKAVRRLTGSSSKVAALVRLDALDPRRARQGLVTQINNDRTHSQPMPVSLDPLDPAGGAVLGDAHLADGRTPPGTLQPGEIIVAEVSAIEPVLVRSDAHAVRDAARQSPVVIDRVTPHVDGFAARRIIGRPMTVEADIFAEGHDLLAAELLWRAADEHDWQRSSMVPLGNDRWRGTMTPGRIGRYFFTIEAWRDEYGSLCHALEVKHHAGVDVAVDVADAVAHLRRLGLGQITTVLAGADADASVRLLTAAETRRQIAATGHRPLSSRHREIAIEIERPQAEFASWYELFPRSLGTFRDVIAHLPRIRAMGFDVLYFPPIHPIGATNRKGRNNALTAGPGDPGSPYAIGAADGGHDAIHAELGTPEDFRRLVAAAAEQGLEIALDFAIQCSPDHPWLKQHPEWFRRRADGSIRYAENPPKKYEDIVNVDFYADGAMPALWEALRDVVLHWVGEGVRIFRVDNPHTKPLPFWEWMIADIRGRHPDVIFLAEAFTRPTMMYRLGMIGFSQSYTYFTWRNSKAELTDYLRELTTTGVADYYRPHLFVNTPDINPLFLQTSGRAGFLIRAALACTLSGLWGVYSGFEICEAAALSGREEYLDSEKYEVRHRDFDAPGNIVAEISTLNRLRRLHPALQSHLGLNFYNAFNDRVMVYGKASARHEDMILVAVSLDPHGVQEASFEVPLWEWQLPDDGSVEVEDLMRGTRFVWRGKVQHVRLDPADLPFAIWRVAPAGARP